MSTHHLAHIRLDDLLDHKSMRLKKKRAAVYIRTQFTTNTLNTGGQEFHKIDQGSMSKDPYTDTTFGNAVLRAFRTF